MSAKTVLIKEEILIAMLKNLPEDDLADIFWKVMVESDTAPLSREEKEAVEEGKKALHKGQTVPWDAIR